MPSYRPLFLLPNEVLIIIVSLLDIPTIFSLRKTCTSLAQISHDRSLWLAIIHRQKYAISLPLPYYTHDLLSLLSIPTPQLEEVAVSAHKVHRFWLLPRSHPAKPNLSPKSGQNLLSLDIFLDRWLLCVYYEGNICLWDIGTSIRAGRDEERPSPGRLCMSHTVPAARGEIKWSSCVAAIDVDVQSILLACSRKDGASTAELYRIALRDFSSEPIVRPSIEVVAEIARTDQSVRALYPALNLVAFSRLDYVDVVNWETKQTVTIPIGSEDIKELWNGVIALRFFPPYIFCVRTRTVELYPMPSIFSSAEHYHTGAADVPLPFLKHSFQNVTFREAAISSIHPSTSSSPVISFLAYDLLQGLFHYQIHLPTFNVKLIGWYGLPSSPLGRRPSAGSIPGFVNACCLGQEGKRGIWVERMMGSTNRGVVVFVNGGGRDMEANDNYLHEGTVGLDGRSINGGEEDEKPKRQKATIIDGRVIYEVRSYDLREDLTHCAFSEVSGRIALGNRSGAVILL